MRCLGGSLVNQVISIGYKKKPVGTGLALIGPRAAEQFRAKPEYGATTMLKLSSLNTSVFEICVLALVAVTTLSMFSGA